MKKALTRNELVIVTRKVFTNNPYVTYDMCPIKQSRLPCFSKRRVCKREIFSTKIGTPEAEPQTSRNVNIENQFDNICIRGNPRRVSDK